MTHDMKLQPAYFNYILNGTKRIEVRLNDEKRKLVKLGDTIKFSKAPELTESFDAKVIGLLNYSNFKDMFENLDASILADKSITKENFINLLEEFYTPEEQKKYGVLGIHFELIK